MNKIVIGLGFGDEGKGLVVDHLCTHSPDPLVIRFSGGHQVGHTVVRNDYDSLGEVSHIFSNFGSGTLRNISTYWSKYCTIEPIGLLNELDILNEKLKGTCIHPSLLIDEQCPITTPYDIERNKELEETNNHGSCGVGFSSTINREEHFYSLTFGDLFYPKILKAKLKAIRNFYGYLPDEKYCFEFLACVNILTNSIYISKVYSCPTAVSYIYEGSQGLLLDQRFGFFPNVTRSNTGCKNATELMKFTENPELYLVTRAYQTRHGNGFMTNEKLSHNILVNPLESNKTNKYQGEFRRSLLDVSLLEYGMNKDEYIRNNINRTLIITCLDHIPNEYRFTYKDEIINCLNETDFVIKVADILKISNILISKSNNSKNIIKIR